MSANCSHCDESIPAGQAVIRSISFERKTFHGHCWDLHQATATPVVSLPVQRVGGSLSERLARAARA